MLRRGVFMEIMETRMMGGGVLAPQGRLSYANVLWRGGGILPTLEGGKREARLIPCVAWNVCGVCD